MFVCSLRGLTASPYASLATFLSQHISTAISEHTEHVDSDMDDEASVVTSSSDEEVDSAGSQRGHRVIQQSPLVADISKLHNEIDDYVLEASTPDRTTRARGEHRQDSI